MEPPALADRTHLHPDRRALGAHAAADIAAELRAVVSARGSARVVLAAAPSQLETLAALAGAPDVDWASVTAFHMDEYLGLPPEAPAGFGNWLRRFFFDMVPLGRVHFLAGGDDPQAAAAAYARVLRAAPIDIVCLGIGVNGHIAFNDPHVADLADPHDVKVVALDETCRRQQVDDGCFGSLDEVPSSALSLTVPRLLDATRLFCMVAGAAKAEAVRAALVEPISASWPCTALRTHSACELYLDDDAAALVDLPHLQGR